VGKGTIYIEGIKGKKGRYVRKQIIMMNRRGGQPSLQAEGKKRGVQKKSDI